MKIFISHSSKDSQLGNIILQLLLDIGVSHDDIIYTSKSGFGIPKGENIFNWLKKELKEKPFVIYLLSDNYYDSIPCLNEMGAVWILENDHIIAFDPSFNLQHSKFNGGAIDPREMGIFLNIKSDIIELVDKVLRKSSKTLNDVHKNRAVERFFDKYNESDFTADYKDSLSNSNTISNKPDFFEEIKQNRLSDEEIILIAYAANTGNIRFGFRWMAEESIQKIELWENKNNLDSIISKNYENTISKLEIREFISVSSETSYGNPREYIFIKDIANQILNLPSDIYEVIDKTLERYKTESEVITNEYDDVPF